jgi:hypothetical protein
MHNTKLIYLLKSLDQQEIRKLELFVHSPFINKNETLSALFGLISKYHPVYESPQLAKEKIFAKLFPGEKFKDERMRYLNSELLAVAEDFLVYNSYTNDPIEKQTRLLNELNRRELDALFDMRKKEMERQIASNAVDSKTLLQKFQLGEVAMKYFHRKLMGKLDEQIKTIDYHEVIKSLTSFYLGYSLKMYATILDQGINYKKENPFRLLDETLEVLQKEMGEQPQLVQMHSACVKLLKTNEERYYFEVRDKLFGMDPGSLAMEDQINFIVIITNFCIRRYKEGNEQYLSEINRLNKFSFERKLFLRDEKMSHVQFSNIVILSIDGNDTEWLDDFIENYSTYLPEDVRESTVSFTKANMAYHKKDFKSALSFLSNAKYESPVRQSAIKNLLLKIYFDKNETELILPLIDSYLHVIKNSLVLTDKAKNEFLNFIRIYQTLYRAKQNKDSKQLMKISEQLKKEKHIAQRMWLQSKVSELIG